MLKVLKKFKFPAKKKKTPLIVIVKESAQFMYHKGKMEMDYM